MILSTHALVGAAIGKNIANPAVIIGLSLAVHFILDSFRHGEYFDSRKATFINSAWKVALDLAFGGGLVLALILYTGSDLIQARNILLGTFFSLLPDLVTVIYWTFHWKILKRIMDFHAFAHRYTRFPKFSKERQWTLRNAFNDILFSSLATLVILSCR